MKVSTLRALLEHASNDDIVAVRDNYGDALIVETAEVEHASYDEDGNATSAGGTVWLHAVNY